MNQEFRVSADGQIHAFPEEGLPEDYVDEKYKVAARRQEKATAEEEAAKEDKKRATAIHKTKDRQLKWADVVRGEDVRLYPLSESAFYAAFLNGLEIPITEAADCLADLDDEGNDGDGVPFDFSEVEGEESEGAA